MVQNTGAPWAVALETSSVAPKLTNIVGMKTLDFYLTPTQQCSYLPGRQVNTLLADPYVPINTRTYSFLINHGFRRSGDYVYRPHCEHCNSCIPVRVRVAEFCPRRSHKRAWRRNQDLHVQRVAPVYSEEHFRLYQRYLTKRHHPNGGMEKPEHYLNFLMSSRIDTGLYEFRLQDELLAVAVVDHLAQGLSAVYTFFDPDREARSLGVYAILWEIDEARRRGLTWLYLGYWIKECPQMSYKDQYRPFEMYRSGQWLRVNAAGT